ncbi:FecR family protein [Steroidobacter sp.]|uniref:FecR family protein n=1 Tax=Steroidobacter sp. TaxID=1978227 RepID=UPI001A582488|nr:FecR domain-containing protein [Steroidobacter sp.]MBL8265984.1 FecR domain-containing protein [Steroidobacter sp.]
MNRTTDDLIRAAVREQASAWSARLLSGELTPTEKVEFLKWLQDNPHNVREYLETARMAKLMSRAFDGLTVESPEQAESDANVVALHPSAVLSRDSRRRSTRFLPLAAAAVIASVAVYWGFQYVNPPGSMTVKVAHGDQRTVRLSDGSVIHLNSETRTRVRYSEHERLIELESGQALFSVAHDTTRPFRVRAGGTEVVAVGAEFDVYRRAGGDITVTVVEGKVDVVGPASAPTDTPLRLSIGQQAQLNKGIPKIAAIDVNAETAWIRREIVISGRPLSEVATEFNRYLSVPIYIDDETLRDTRISGTFSAYNETAFLAFLREFEGVQVDVGERGIHVTRER